MQIVCLPDARMIHIMLCQAVLMVSKHWHSNTPSATGIMLVLHASKAFAWYHHACHTNWHLNPWPQVPKR